MEYTLDDCDFGNLTRPDENCPVNYIPGRDKIKTNWLDWFENNQRNCEQCQCGIWTEGSNQIPIHWKIGSLESQVPSGLMSEKKIASIRK